MKIKSLEKSSLLYPIFQIKQMVRFQLVGVRPGYIPPFPNNLTL